MTANHDQKNGTRGWSPMPFAVHELMRAEKTLSDKSNHENARRWDGAQPVSTGDKISVQVENQKDKGVHSVLIRGLCHCWPAAEAGGDTTF